MGSFGGDYEGAHVLAMPLPQQGHIIPMLRFTTALAQKGLTVSFVCYEGEIPLLAASSGADDASSELPTSLDSFRFVMVRKPRQEDPAGYLEPATVFGEAFEPLLQKLLHDKSAGVSAGPTCVISDALLAFSQDAAEELQIPRYAFVPSGVMLVRFLQCAIGLFESGQFQVSETDGTLIKFDRPICISGLPPLHFNELFFHHFPAKLLIIAKSSMRSAGFLVNSFLELEEKVVEICRNPTHSLDKHGKVPKVYPVGPWFSTEVITNTTSIKKGLEDSRGKCLHWLGSQPASSALYVAFGSRVRLLPEEIIEMAHGLEACNLHFLWVIPQPKETASEVLPPGFKARVGDRGCIVTGWAPQMEILAHPATGSFVSHAGWNSCLESISFGVPMILWPKRAEQPLNCRYLVEDLKVAIQLQTGEDNRVKRNEVEKAVRRLMLDSEGVAVRSRMQELQRKATAATAVEGGSKSRIFREFLEDVCDHSKASGNTKLIRTCQRLMTR